MNQGPVTSGGGWLTRDVLLLSMSAFFADMGYQAVTAVFPLLIVIRLGEPAYVYGALLALSFGVGSLFSLVGGEMGDRHSKKAVSLAGNLLIPLMSVSVLLPNVVFVGAFFVFGWWARYFRTPARRAWLVEVSDPAHRSKVFGFLHALDVGGGMIAVIYSIVLVLLGAPLDDIVLVTMIPILASSLALAFARTTPHPAFHAANTSSAVPSEREERQEKENSFVFRWLLVSAMLFGFSYYALGFPIITVAQSQGSAVLGILTFGIYLGVSAGAGYLLGSVRSKRPLRTLWTLGYLLAALSSLVIGASYTLHFGLGFYYLGAAGLGFATGSVETFEPVLTSTLTKAGNLSRGLGRLSSSRALGLFTSNLVMGAIFTFSQFGSYAYAAALAGSAAVILLAVETKTKVR
ncbi:MAG: MFS transporter [Nitrososphaerota archaeon]|nr:MFS transporter [Nitrososphaerota archaeon]MDG6919123.1 MFS transporter [Nitrososphaerota archaeon]